MRVIACERQHIFLPLYDYSRPSPHDCIDVDEMLMLVVKASGEEKFRFIPADHWKIIPTNRILRIMRVLFVPYGNFLPTIEADTA